MGGSGTMAWIAGFLVTLLAGCLTTPAQVSAVVGIGGAPAGVTTRISVSAGGHAGDGVSGAPEPSFDGRFVVFVSAATNLVAGDANGATDVFVRDLLLGVTERVSVASDGTEANGASDSAHISSDGRFVAFRSAADNLVPGDTNGLDDAFVHDRALGTTERVSVATTGQQGDAPVRTVSISGNGRFVAFSSRATALHGAARGRLMKIFVHDRRKDTTGLLDLGGRGRPNGSSHASSVSENGRFIGFRSAASNLVDGDTNGAADAFVRDRMFGRTIRVSVSSSGRQGNLTSFRPQLSSSGRLAVFRSRATNLVRGDTGPRIDVFVHDLQTGITRRVNVDSRGEEADRSALILPGISGNGRFVVFASAASNLVGDDANGKADIFVHDRWTGITRRLSLGHDGAEANGGSRLVHISGDARVVTFGSDASNLVPDDVNGLADAFAFVFAPDTPGGP